MKLALNFILILLLTATLSATSQNVPSWKINDVVNYMDESDSVLVISFWATFCKPCIEEIPYMESITKKYKDQKVKLLLVSLDLKDFYPNRIQDFAKKNNYSSQVVWLNESNADYFCPKIDKSWSGAIPSTVIINRKTGYKKFFEDQVKPGQFEAALKRALGI
jgi:thiol-disulfide isomerase/thioredoxin